MKFIVNRFDAAFKNLKRHLDMIPMTAYQREDALRELIEMKHTFEQIIKNKEIGK